MATLEVTTRRRHKEVRKNEPASHPLDNDIDLRKRVLLQAEAIKRVRETALTQKEPALTRFANDLIGGEIYMRQDLNRPEDTVATAIGTTESSIDGLIATNHSMSYRPPDSKKTLTMSQEERRKEFYEVVIPGVERVVVLVPGFESTRNVFEVPINKKVLNPGKVKETDPKKILKDGKTLVISLSVMGSEHNADPQLKDRITPFSVVGQIYEALDRIGLQVMHYKTAQMETQGWANLKNRLSENLDIALIQKNKPMVRQLVKEIATMVRDEQEIINGTYWHNRIAAVIGHSMGAWFATQLLLINFYQGYANLDQVMEYWSAIGENALQEHNQMNEMISISRMRTRDRGLDMFYNWQRSMNSRADNPYGPSRSFYNLLPKAAFYGIAPVERGTYEDDARVKEAKQNGDEALSHVKFMREKKSYLMHFMKYLAVHGMLGLRNLSLTVGDLVNYAMTEEFVGANALGALEIIFNHMFTFKDDPDFHIIGTNVINSMRKIIGQRTMQQLDGYEILNRFHIYIPKKDRTLRMRFVTKWLMELVVNLISSSNMANPLSSVKTDELIAMFSTEVSESPHYMTDDGWDMIVDRASEWLHNFQDARYQEAAVGAVSGRLLGSIL